MRGQTVVDIDWKARKVVTEDSTFTGKTIILAQGSHAGMKMKKYGELELAAKLGHAVVPFSQALVPLNYNQDYALGEAFCTLAGISVPVAVKVASENEEKHFEGSLLFTHNGLSGPVILNASLYWQEGASLEIDFLPGENFELLLDAFPRQTPLSTGRRRLPSRLCDVLLAEKGSRKNGQLSRTDRKILSEKIHKTSVKELHKADLKFAEACKGGVTLKEIDASSMQSRLRKDLYIIGEMTEMTGQLGGYNLHWAWASAFCASKHICGYDPLANWLS